jgi:hypothetical protein
MKEVKDLCNGNSHWRNNWKKTVKDGRTSYTQELTESIFWKWLCYQNQSICSMQSPSKFSDIIFRERKINCKVHIEAKNTSNSQSQFWTKKSNTEDIIILDFRLHLRDIEIKLAFYWHKNRHEGQRGRIEDPDINPHSYSNMTF